MKLIKICLYAFTLIAINSYGQKKIKLVPFLKSNGKYIYVDSSNMKPLWQKEYQEANLFVDNLAKVKLNNNYGYIDLNGKEVIPIKYPIINDFEYGYAEAINPNESKSIFYNKNGKRVNEIEISVNLSAMGITRSMRSGAEYYPFIYDNFEGKAIFIDEVQKYGIIDEKLNVIQKAKFDFIGNFYNGYATFKLNNKWGLFDFKGRILINNEFDRLIRYKYGFIYTINNKEGFLNKNGVKISDPIFDNIYFRNFYLINKRNGQYGVIDSTGKTLIPNRYENIELLKIKNEDYFIVKKDKLFGLLDVNGELILPNEFDKIFNVDYKDTSLLIVEKNNKQGLFDLLGNEIIPCEFDEIKGFHNNKVALKINNKWYINDLYQPINLNENETYDSVIFFDNNIMWLLDGKFVFKIIDSLGNNLCKNVYSYISRPENKFAQVEFKNQKGVLYYDGSEVIKLDIKNNEKSFEFYDGYILVNKQYYIDKKGREFRSK